MYSAHEGRRHRDRVPVGQHELRPAVPEVLHDREQVVPAARVQPRGVLAQLVEDLLHLVRRRDGLDQHGGPHGAARQAQLFLGEDEHLVPQPRLVVQLGLGEVEVWAAAPLGEVTRVVEEVQAEVDQGAGDGAPVHPQVPLVQVPAARAYDDGGQLRVRAQGVRLALGAGEVDAPGEGVPQVELAADHVLPGRRRGVLEVGEPDAGAGVERVDGHLPVGRTGDLHAPVLERVPRRGDPPVARADGRGLWQEVERAGTGDLRAACGAPRQQCVAARREPLVQRADEGERRVGEDLVLAVGAPRGVVGDRDGDGRRGLGWCGHEGSLSFDGAPSAGTLPGAGGANAAACGARWADEGAAMVLLFDGE